MCLPDGHGRVALAAVLAELHVREVNELHVEAGAVLNGAWLRSGLVDELLVYMAPRLLGPGLPMAELPALAAMELASVWNFVDTQAVGADIRLRLRPDMSKNLTVRVPPVPGLIP
jgi:diaminohydroxyphosphoribosylaminopyrimidine deaminase/5-amino-6-(5-phosphoribosylamino)uracil reductase